MSLVIKYGGIAQLAEHSAVLPDLIIFYGRIDYVKFKIEGEFNGNTMYV